MISVCIPVFNYDVRPLVRALSAQAAELAERVETVCIDDCSTDEFRTLNAEVGSLCRWVQLEENVGRARIRNLFLQHTEGEWLLLLDNDSIIPDGFLRRYAELVAESSGVVVGGRVYDRHSDNAAHHLRYLYGVECESKPAKERAQHPYRSFMTCNFAVRREVLEQIRFDERLAGYGHEDTLFGYRLMQQEVPILHVDNPVINGDVEENAVFLAKSEEAVRSLVQVYRFLCGDSAFCHTVRLLATYRRLQRLHLTGLVHWLYRLMRRPLREHFLEGRSFSIGEFSFYKLGLFIEENKNT